METPKRTFFFKASRSPEHPQRLDPVWIAKNHARGIATTLLLDTNILIHMEKVVMSGNKPAALKDKGLHNLISLLHRSPAQSIYLSPGQAFDEMPPALAEQCREHYEIFCAQHLPQFVDSPDSLQARYSGKSHGYGFFDLDEKTQAVLAIPFCSLIYLQLTDRIPNLPPIERFKSYLNSLVQELDLLSAKEVEVARYCFANPPADCRDTIALRRVVRRNFAQTKEGKLPFNAEQLLGSAFNGACDLTLLNSANVIDNNPIDGIQQDCWITTRDEKLYKFGELAHCLNIDGTAGKYTAPSYIDEHEADPYWRESKTFYQTLLSQRMAYYESKPLDVQGFPLLARRAAEIARRSFA